MFVTYDQFYVATFLFALGFIFSAVLGVFDIPVQNKALLIVKNVIIFLLFIIISVIYCILSVKLNFPSFRIYMPILFFLGLYSERKTLRLVLAKLYKKLYNKFRIKKVKNDGR